MEEVKQWISTDETATQFFSRIATKRPRLLLPPLHRVPLRPGNVLEISGPSPSAKTLILLQVVVDCILPKEWKGVSYGGLELSVMFIDLDCRLDVSRLLLLLKHRISSVDGSRIEVNHELQDILHWRCDEELITKCLERFLYIRCYDSLEFLATLKTLRYQVQRRKECGSKVHLMMIDSIGAYYWVDRASASLPLGCNSRCFCTMGYFTWKCSFHCQLTALRKLFSLQSVTEAIVHEIQNFLLIQPVLVLASKAMIFGDKSVSSDRRTFKKWSSQDASGQSTVVRGLDNTTHREYMPYVWQSFVTHRIFVQPSSLAISAENYNEQTYSTQWLQPSLDFKDKFVVRDAGIFMIP